MQPAVRPLVVLAILVVLILVLLGLLIFVTLSGTASDAQEQRCVAEQFFYDKSTDCSGSPIPAVSMPPPVRFVTIESDKCSWIGGGLFVQGDCRAKRVEFFHDAGCSGTPTRSITDGVCYIAGPHHSGRSRFLSTAGTCKVDMAYYSRNLDACRRGDEVDEEARQVLTNMDQTCVDFSEGPHYPRSMFFDCANKVLRMYNSTIDCTGFSFAVSEECAVDDIGHAYIASFTKG